MVDQSELCPVCKCPKSESEKGSLTQWILVCKCDLTPIEEDGDQRPICQDCRKPLGTSSSGTLTSFIFKEGYCECSRPALSSCDSDGAESGDEQIHDLNPEMFPLERYIPLDRLGKGGIGQVYLARDTILNKNVAVKLLNYIDSDRIVAFQNEARTTSRLQHKNIIQIVDFGVTGNMSPYMVLEYFPGRSLAELVSEAGPLPWREACSIFLPILDALIYAHGEGVLHRDLKPGNIILSDQLDVKVIDFGIASIAESGEHSGNSMSPDGAFAGSPLYLSGSFAGGDVYDRQSEIYSLGCVLYEMLTGRPPFLGETLLETLEMHSNAPVPSLSGEVQDLPGAFDDIIAGCLAKGAEDRYESIESLQKAIEDLISAEESLPEPDLPEEPARKRTDYFMTSLVSLVAACSLFVLSLALNRSVSMDQGGQLATSLSSTSEDSEAGKQAYKKDQNILANIPDSAIEKELGWTGGKWEFKEHQKAGFVEAIGHAVDDGDLLEIPSDKTFSHLKFTLESSISGSGLKSLKGRDLTSFWTMSGRFDDRGINNLVYFPTLTKVQIDSPAHLHRASYRKLSQLPSLAMLSLRSIFDLPKGSFAEIAKCKGLTALSLEFVEPVTNSDLEELKALTKLRFLRLYGLKRIDDSSTQILKELPLHRLDIGATRVSDKGLLVLAQMKYLRYLNVSIKSEKEIELLREKSPGIEVAAISPQGIKRFKVANPAVRVRSEGGMLEEVFF